jgi:hypothetical protein
LVCCCISEVRVGGRTNYSVAEAEFIRRTCRNITSLLSSCKPTYINLLNMSAHTENHVEQTLHSMPRSGSDQSQSANLHDGGAGRTTQQSLPPSYCHHHRTCPRTPNYQLKHRHLPAVQYITHPDQSQREQPSR